MTTIKDIFSRGLRVCIVCVIGMSFSSIAFAGDVAVNLLAGGSTMNVGKSNSVVFPASAYRTDTFTTNDNPINLALAAGVMDDFLIQPSNGKFGTLLHDVTLGVDLYYNQTVRNGTVLQYGLPSFANSTYNMQLESSRLMLDSELDFHPLCHDHIIPFVEGGIGAALNTLSFKNNPLPNIGAGGGYYFLQDNSEYSFAYQLGLGIKVPINDHLYLSGRYLYANAGHETSSVHDNSNGVVVATPIKVNVESQSVLFGLSYLFG